MEWDSIQLWCNFCEEVRHTEGATYSAGNKERGAISGGASDCAPSLQCWSRCESDAACVHSYTRKNNHYYERSGDALDVLP